MGRLQPVLDFCLAQGCRPRPAKAMAASRDVWHSARLLPVSIIYRDRMLWCHSEHEQQTPFFGATSLGGFAQGCAAPAQGPPSSICISSAGGLVHSGPVPLRSMLLQSSPASPGCVLRQVMLLWCGHASDCPGRPFAWVCNLQQKCSPYLLPHRPANPASTCRLSAHCSWVWIQLTAACILVATCYSRIIPRTSCSGSAPAWQARLSVRSWPTALRKSEKL